MYTPETEAPTVHLGLEYDPEPAPRSPTVLVVALALAAAYLLARRRGA